MITRTVKYNSRDVSCSDICALLEKNSELSKNNHTTEEYDFKD